MATISHQKLTTSKTSTNVTCSSANLRHRVHLHHQKQRLLQSAQPRTILLSFLLVSCLISINCASYGRQLSSLDRWRDPEYRFSSADSRDETGSSLEDLLSRLNSPNVEKQQQQSLGDQQFEGYYYGLPNDPPPNRQSELQYVEQLPNVDYNRRLAELLVDGKDLQQPQQQQNQHIDISSPLYLLLDKSREPNDNEVVFGQKRFEPETQSAGAAAAAATAGDPSSAYQLIDDEAAFGLDANKKQTEDETAGGKQQQANFTTLLEDESEEVEITNPTTTTSAPATTTTITSSTAKDAALSSDNSGVEQKSYAQNVTKASGVKSSARSIEGTSLSSVLSDFYAKLSAYLPFTHQSSAVVDNSINKQQTSSGGAAKQRVSDSTGKTISVGSHLGDSNGNEEEDSNGVSYSYDKNTERSTDSSGQVLKVHINRPLEENQRISLMRKSALSVPVAEARDEPLAQHIGPSTIVRQYKYLPDQQVLYSSGLEGAGQGVGGELYEARPYSRHLQPGDDIYGSYRSAMFNVARPGEQPLSLVANKSNDVYFLAMVAAFCAMAMAVVLAAGLFAYRIQQNRKLTSETEYPTYGVVGPNNKCGAAAFVGGYFAGNTTGSSSSMGSGKVGSAKHLTDLYSNASDSGITHSSSKSLSGKRALTCDQNNSPSGGGTGTGTNTSGASRGDFLASNQNAARMYHYQHQKQQMIISDRGSNGRHTSASDLDSEEENDDGSYTVYECPGLASAHEMEIKNPLFNDDRTP